MKNTKIAWAHHTFNAWRGCDQVSPACDNCYAMTMAKRNPAVLGVWGAHGTRIIAEPNQWLEVMRWNAAAAWRGVRERVFVNSMSDTFEEWHGIPTFTNGAHARPLGGATWGTDGVLPFVKAPLGSIEKGATLGDVRDWLMWLVFVCQNLDFLFLTKRVSHMSTFMAHFYTGDVDIMPGTNCLPNLWLGATVEDNAAKARIAVLRDIPAAVHYVSAEPMIQSLWRLNLKGIDWVICGGESAKGSHEDGSRKLRPMKAVWAKDLRDDCKLQDVAFFFKQWGNALPVDQRASLSPQIAWRTLEPVCIDKSEYFVLPNKDDTGRLLDGVEHLAIPHYDEVPA